MKRFVLAVFVALVLHSSSSHLAVGQGVARSADRLQRLYTRIDAIRTEHRVPSAQIALIQPDTTIILNFGVADLDTGAPVTDETMFRAGSVSKSVAGVAIMMLVERGLVSLDDRVRDLAPELDIRSPWYTTHPVQLRHLVEAGAGFVGLHPEDYANPAEPPDIALAEVIGDMPYRLDVQWRPGDYTSYHDLGPTITAYLIEKLTGQRYEDFVQDNIFGPLGMRRSSFFLTDTVAAYLAEPHAAKNPDAVPYEHYRLRPSGALNTSAREFSAFVRMLLGRGTFEGKRLLRPESVERIERSTTTLAARKAGLRLGYGINNYSTNYRGIVFRGHAGNTANYTAFYGYEPVRGTGFVFMSTVSDSGAWILWSAVAEVFAYLEPSANPPSPQLVPAEERAALSGCYARLNPWTLTRATDHVRVRAEGPALVLSHDESGRVATLERTARPMTFWIRDWRPNRDEITDAVFVPDDEGRLVLQMLNYPFEAYGWIECG